ncbi:MAG: flagellar hook-basal body complex protein [Planctomycetaceae bacterium]|nr:flagellar hook-basal body complex protein [Planctomycetaceae bacterium]
MSYGLYLSAEGAHAQNYRLETIANNIANVDTPGFKRELAVQQARHTQRIEYGHDAPDSGSMNDVSGGVLTIGTLTEIQKQGTSMVTGEKTDMEIVGEGFFLVQHMQTGEQFLTRAGHFQKLPDGRLVTHSGSTEFAVCDMNGQPIVMTPGENWDWDSNDAGEIVEAGVHTPVALVVPQNYAKMVKQGKNMFKSEEGFTPVDTGNRKIKPRHLEGSAVDPAAEMVELIAASRLIETNLKMVQQQDDMTNGLISKVLRVS